MAGRGSTWRTCRPPIRTAATACRADRSGRWRGPVSTAPTCINADGAALDDRFADGWSTSDVAATDPGADPGAAAGLHALVGGSLVSLDGQQRAAGGRRRSGRLPGPDRGGAVAQRAGGGVGGDAAARCARTWPRRCGSARWAATPRRRIDGRTLTAAQLVAGRRDLGGGGRHQRGAGHPGGGVGAAGPHPRRLARRWPTQFSRPHRRTASCRGTAPAPRWSSRVR